VERGGTQHIVHRFQLVVRREGTQHIVHWYMVSSGARVEYFHTMSSASRVKPAARSGAKAPTTPAVASVPFTGTAAAAALQEGH